MTLSACTSKPYAAPERIKRSYRAPNLNQKLFRALMYFYGVSRKPKPYSRTAREKHKTQPECGGLRQILLVPSIETMGWPACREAGVSQKIGVSCFCLFPNLHKRVCVCGYMRFVPYGTVLKLILFPTCRQITLIN